MANTGKKRAQRLVVKKYYQGIDEPAAELDLDFKKAFDYNNKSYPEITVEALKGMDISSYTARLNDFNLYVEGQMPGLQLKVDTVEGSEAYIEDLGMCPIV